MLARLLALVCVAALATTAAPAVGSAQPSESARQARVHYESGQRFFTAGRFELAIDEFKEAYRLSKRPALWFNIGQAYRLAGDCVEALVAYEKFVELDPKAVDRTNVNERIDEMRTCVRQGPAGGGAAGAADETPAADAESVGDPGDDAASGDQDADESTEEPQEAEVPVAGVALDRPATSERKLADGRTSRWIGGSLLGIGLVSAGSSIYLVLRASSEADDLTARYVRGGTWDPDAVDAENHISSDKRNAAILAGVGGVAVVAGTYLYLSGREQAEYARRFSVIPRRGGAQVGWSFQF